MSTLTFAEQLERCEKQPATRYEFKYLLRSETAKQIEHFLTPQLSLDPHCQIEPSGHYTVRSIYWDSPHFESFYNKLGGQRFREKFRLRTYGRTQEAPHFLELKQKTNLDYVKRKVKLNHNQLDQIANRSTDFLDALNEADRAVMDRFFFHLIGKAYLPTSLMVYERRAFSDAIDDTLRITFDRNLRSRIFPQLADFHSDSNLESLLGGWVIFEVKFSQLVPRWMGNLNKMFQLKQQACSKYCNSVGHFLGETPTMQKGFWHH